jgi:putative spermidine/putrescine transport system substrate-binding protein
MKRRHLIRAGISAPVLLGTPSIQRVFAQTATTIRIATWGGSWRDSLEKNVAGRLAQKGIKLEYTLGNPEDNIAKLIAAKRQGQVPFDVLEFTPAQKIQLVRGGIFEKPDYDRLPNASTLPAWTREEFLVSVQYTGDGVAYNADRLSAAGVSPPALYTDLISDKLRSHLSFPEPSNGAHWSTVTALAYSGGGSEANMQPAIELVNRMNPGSFYSSSPDLATKFGNGDVWIAPLQSGWALRLRKSGLPINVAYERIGEHQGAIWPICQGVVKGTPNSAGAHMFINEFLSFDAQYGHGVSTGSLPVNSQARQKLADDPELKAMLLLTDAQIDNAFRINWEKFDQKRWRDMWNRDVHR